MKEQTIAFLLVGEGSRNRSKEETMVVKSIEMFHHTVSC